MKEMQQSIFNKESHRKNFKITWHNQTGLKTVNYLCLVWNQCIPRKDNKLQQSPLLFTKDLTKALQSTQANSVSSLDLHEWASIQIIINYNAIFYITIEKIHYIGKWQLLLYAKKLDREESAASGVALLKVVPKHKVKTKTNMHREFRNECWKQFK